MIAVALGVVAGGCTPHADVEPLTALATHTVGPAKAPQTVVDAADLMALRPEWRTYRIIGGNEVRDAISVIIEPIEGEDRPTWRVEQGDGRIQTMRLREDGALVVPRVTDLKNNAVTHYAAPLVFLPGTLEPNVPVRSGGPVRVVSRDDPDGQLSRGSCTQMLYYEGRQRLQTPAGSFDCHRLRIEYDAELNTATVKRRAWAFFAPGVGLVAEVSDEQVRALLLGWVTQRTMVLETVQPTVMEVMP